MPIDQIQKFLGHAKPETTRIHAESSTEMIVESHAAAGGNEWIASWSANGCRIATMTRHKLSRTRRQASCPSKPCLRMASMSLTVISIPPVHASLSALRRQDLPPDGVRKSRTFFVEPGTQMP
jgi:hypothetical protein